MDNDLKKYKLAINKHTSIVDLLTKLNPNNYYAYDKPCFCPFHDNTNTPAAALYSGDNGDSLFCFAERKVYTPADVIEKLYKKDVYSVGENLFNKLNKSQQREIEETINPNYLQTFAASKQVKPEETKKYFQLYKNKDIVLNDYLDKLIGKGGE